MKRRHLLALTLPALAVPKVGTVAQERTLRLTIVAGHPQIFLWVKHLKESFIPAVDAELATGSGYRIAWNEAYGGSLARVGGELDAISNGLADLGYNPSLFNPSRLPLQNVAFLTPFSSDKPRVVTQVVEELQGRVPEMGRAWERHNQVYLGGGISIDSYQLLTKFPVRSLDDLRGRRIGAPGSAVNWINGTGAVPVGGDLTGFYNSLATGLYEGVVMFATAAAPAKLAEVAPHVTRVDFGSAYAGGLTVNRGRWSAFPQPVKAAMAAGVAAYARAFYDEQDRRIDEAYETMRGSGATISVLAPAERARWAEAIPNAARTWAAGLEGNRQPGRAVLSGFMDGLRARGEAPPRAWDRE